MLKELEKTAVRTGLVHQAHDWSKVARQDIYRQRVFGTETGAENFLPRDQKRKLGIPSFLLHVLLIGACVKFTYSRTAIQNTFRVNDAVKGAIQEAKFPYNVHLGNWDDLDSVEALKAWLPVAFASAVSPAVRNFNVLIGTIRFTLRRIDQIPNKIQTEQRFGDLSPYIWKQLSGISARETSAKDDDTNPFGAYRVWGTNQDTSGTVGLEWCSANSHACSDGEELKTLVFVRTPKAAVGRCRSYCEWLSDEIRPCRCFTLYRGHTCTLYHIPESKLQKGPISESSPETTDCFGQSARRPELKATVGSTAMWPRMAAFEFKHENEKAGWHETPGFVMHLRSQNNAHVLEVSQQEGANPPPTQAQAFASQIKDWIAGGMLSKGFAVLTIDFLLHNPNYQVYTWCKLIFRESASGDMNSKLRTSSLHIRNSDLDAQAFDLASEMDFWDGCYIFLIGVSIVAEIVDFGKRGLTYLYRIGNWLTIFSLVLHLATIISRSVFLANSDFTQRLISFRTQPYSASTVEFQTQYKDYEWFLIISAANMCISCMKGIHILHDIVPRVGILLNTMQRAITPIVLFVVVCIDVFVGFVLWGTLMFGKSVAAFKSWDASVTSCTELLFGNVDSVQELLHKYPFAGSFFFMTYMLLFYITAQNVCKAVFLASYNDATLLEKVPDVKPSMAAMSRTKTSFIFTPKPFEGWKRTFWSVLQDRVGGNVKFPRKELHSSQRPKMLEPLVFCIFCILYVALTYYMVKVSWSFDLANSIKSAIRTPSFHITDKTLGTTTRRHSFDTVKTRQGVESFFAKALPQTLFDTSDATFAGSPNGLKRGDVNQLVINNWNILLGSKPVRISTRLWHLEEVGEKNAINGIINADTRLQARDPEPSITDSSGMHFSPPLKEVTAFSGIVDPKQRAIMEHYNCTYGLAYGSSSLDSPAGFSCMLGVDRAKTVDMLTELVRNKFISEQTATVSVDFVAYNGFADAFVYVAVLFQFQPSGVINRNIFTTTVQTDLHDGSYWWRVSLEVLVWLLNTGFIIISLRWLVKGMVEQVKYDWAISMPCSARICRSLFALFIRSFFDWWTLLDLVSGILMTVTLALWTKVSLSQLSQEYELPSNPAWTQARCAETDLCGDDEVLWAFFQQGEKLRTFSRICAINTVLVFFRVLKYLRIFSRVQVLFMTLRSGSVDLFWCLVTMVFLLTGFVCMGHQFFGPRVHGFSSIPEGCLTCFQMFLGTYDYGQLHEEDTLAYFVFSYTFMVAFRYMMLNMFFAIIDQHFNAAAKTLFENPANPINLNPKRSLHQLSTRIKSLIRKSHSMKDGSRTEPERDTIAEVGAQRLGEQELRESAGAIARRGEAAARKGKGEECLRRPGSFLSVESKIPAWLSLPDEMTSWAEEEADAHSIMLDQFVSKRASVEHSRHELEKYLDEVETSIATDVARVREEGSTLFESMQLNEMHNLREIHQDQESLAWYIMKREAELKKLEMLKASKEEHFDKIKSTMTLFSDS